MDKQIEEVFKDLRRSSHLSVVLTLLGGVMLVGSVYYSVTRLRPLQVEIAKTERELSEKTAQWKALQASVALLSKDQEKLLDFIAMVTDKSSVKLLDPDVDWSLVKTDMASLRPGNRKQAVLISVLMAWKSIPFALGGESVGSGFDSPRFLNYVLSKVGAGVTPKKDQRLSDALMEKYKRVKEPRPGDLVFYKGQVGSFGFIYLSGGKNGTDPVGVGTLQAIAPLQIISLRNVNTADFPLIGYFRVVYPDEAEAAN